MLSASKEVEAQLVSMQRELGQAHGVDQSDPIGGCISLLIEVSLAGPGFAVERVGGQFVSGAPAVPLTNEVAPPVRADTFESTAVVPPTPKADQVSPGAEKALWTPVAAGTLASSPPITPTVLELDKLSEEEEKERQTLLRAKTLEWGTTDLPDNQLGLETPATPRPETSEPAADLEAVKAAKRPAEPAQDEPVPNKQPSCSKENPQAKAKASKEKVTAEPEDKYADGSYWKPCSQHFLKAYDSRGSAITSSRTAKERSSAARTSCRCPRLNRGVVWLTCRCLHSHLGTELRRLLKETGSLEQLEVAIKQRELEEESENLSGGYYTAIDLKREFDWTEQLGPFNTGHLD